MKLKLSTLLVIIGVIFFAYYYFVHVPCQAAGTSEQPGYVPMPPAAEEEQYGNGVTALDVPAGEQEGFGVTPLDDDAESRQEIRSTYDSTSLDDIAGNVRPDNVMQVDEPVTML